MGAMDLRKIIAYLEENLLEPLTPALIAKHFYVSVSSLNSLFKAVCGIPVMEYVRNRRLSLAGQALKTTDARIVDLAYQYGYETPEAFAKAFARFHGFPPGFVRRVFPEIKMFQPLDIRVDIRGGFATDSRSDGQDNRRDTCYHGPTTTKGGMTMETGVKTHEISIRDMEFKEDWKMLLALGNRLDEAGLAYKVDGKTMVFAHGLEFKLDKICVTFKWNDERRVAEIFGYDGEADTKFANNFKYFDARFQGMKVRCMFYGDVPGDDTDEFLYNNTDLVLVDGQTLRAQTLEFFAANTEPEGALYQRVDRWLKSRA